MRQRDWFLNVNVENLLGGDEGKEGGEPKQEPKKAEKEQSKPKKEEEKSKQSQPKEDKKTDGKGSKADLNLTERPPRDQGKPKPSPAKVPLTPCLQHWQRF